MTAVQLNDDTRKIVENALASIIPAFALLRNQSDDQHYQQAAISNNDAVSPDYACLIAHGISECDAFDLLLDRERKRSEANPVHIRRKGYHLVCLQETQAGAYIQDRAVLADILERQLDFAIRLIEAETHRHQCNRDLALITHALDALPLSVFVLDENRRYVFQNRNDRETFKDLRGMKVEEAGLDAKMSLTWARQHDAVLRGENFDRKDEKRSNGVSFTSRTMMGPVQDEDGICGIVGLALDCSAEANAMLLLRDNEERLQSWLKLSSDWVWEADAQFRYTRVEGDAQKHGFDFSQWLGRTRWEVTGGDSVNDPLWAGYKSRLEAQEAIRGFRAEITRYDGKPIIVETNADPLYDDHGVFIGYRGVTRNVTEREELLKRLQRAELIANETQHAITITDAKGRITWVNPAFTKISGYAIDDVVGYTPGSILQCPETDPQTVEEIRAALRNGEGIRTTILNRARDGRHYWLDLEIRPIHRDDGSIDGFIAIENDVTDLVEDRNRKDAIFENATAGIVIHDETGIAVDCNQEAEKILGVTADRFLGVAVADRDWQLVDVDGSPLAPDETPQARASRDNRPVRNQIMGAKQENGSIRWLRVSARVFSMGAGKAHTLVSFTDVTEEENARREVQEAHELLSSIIETMPDALAAYDQDDRLLFCNSAYKSFYAVSSPAIRIGASFESILRYGLERGQFKNVGETPEQREKWLRERIENHRKPKPEMMVTELDDGRWLQIRERVTPSGISVGVRTDITALKQAEQKIRLAAERDALTGLVNRAAFMQRFDQTINGSRDNDGAGLVALIDLDHFKELNDTLGHDVGDACLREISRRLLQATRSGDVVARLGGDEFAVLMPGITDREEGINAVQAVVDLITKAVSLGGKVIYPQMSVGVSMYPEDGMNVTELLKNADIAMYATKNSGRNGITVFDPAQKHHLARRTFISEHLREALRNEMLDVAFQAQVDLNTGRHLGFEALARWRFSGEQISPAEFIPIAEEFGLSQEIDMQVLNKSLLQLKRLKDIGHAPGKVAVNIGTVLLRDDTFPLRVANLLSDSGLSPLDLEIEVTERVLIERGHEKFRANLAALRDLGVTIALDDFGTGYASLTHLKDFHIDKLKIDQTFIRDIAFDRNDETIVKTIINLARSLEIQVVAEGIETKLQKQFLASHGCQSGQGYLFHRPETAFHEIAEYLGQNATTKASQPRYYRGTRIA